MTVGDQKCSGDVIEEDGSTKILYWHLVFDLGIVTYEVSDYLFLGSGRRDDPYAVIWIPNDPRNHLNFSNVRKWALTSLVVDCDPCCGAALLGLCRRKKRSRGNSALETR